MSLFIHQSTLFLATQVAASGGILSFATAPLGQSATQILVESNPSPTTYSEILPPEKFELRPFAPGYSWHPRQNPTSTAADRGISVIEPTTFVVDHVVDLEVRERPTESRIPDVVILAAAANPDPSQDLALLAEMWRLRATSYDALVPQFRDNPDVSRRLGLWGDELRGLANRLYVRFSSDPDQRQKEIEANRQINNRADELRVMQALLLRDADLLSRCLNELMRNTTDPNLPMGKDPYELDVYHYRALRLAYVAISQGLVTPEEGINPPQAIRIIQDTVEAIFQKAPSYDRAVKDFLESPRVAVSDEHELKEFEAVASFFLRKIGESIEALAKAKPKHQRKIETKLFSLSFGFLKATQGMAQVYERQFSRQGKTANVLAFQRIENEISTVLSQIKDLSTSTDPRTKNVFRAILLDRFHILPIKISLALEKFVDAYLKAEAYLDGLYERRASRPFAELYEGFSLIAEALEGLGQKREARQARNQAKYFSDLANQTTRGEA